MNTLREFIEEINKERFGEAVFRGEVRYNEPMAAHTTFRVGGPADCWIRPHGDIFPEYAETLRGAAKARGIPVFVLGAGANLVVADRGIRGIVLDTGGWAGFDAAGSGAAGARSVFIRSGTPVDAAAEAAAEAGLGGLEFLAGMPGSIGGAVWMNARCYGRSLSDCLVETEILEARGKRIMPYRAEDFSYKKSPFQGRDTLILGARFALTPRPEQEIRDEMAALRRDRTMKGHYRFPSAGSAFKNNRSWGKPAGQIIDEVGLRGLSRGGAAVAEWHGNIIINRENARAEDIRSLVREVTARVRAARGIELEPEILFAGEWEEASPSA
ncbi:MAG: UDP-N-acetylmuramate dehydrogenase [Treponema sp.]|jgi:UDP-N-acetylmuramate dehydrogenase|nr:UDP-N-acetylmuramate dehydrogenase [Treponema sp.]